MVRGERYGSLGYDDWVYVHGLTGPREGGTETVLVRKTSTRVSHNWNDYEDTGTPSSSTTKDVFRRNVMENIIRRTELGTGITRQVFKRSHQIKEESDRTP